MLPSGSPDLPKPSCLLQSPQPLPDTLAPLTLITTSTFPQGDTSVSFCPSPPLLKAYFVSLHFCTVRKASAGEVALASPEIWLFSFSPIVYNQQGDKASLQTGHLH